MEGKFKSGTPYVQGQNYGIYLSHISLDLELENNHYKVVSSEVENIDTFSTFTENSTQIDNIYSKYDDDIVAIRDKVLYTFLSDVSKSKFGSYIAESILNYANSETEVVSSLGCINSGGGVRDDVLVGEFTYGDLIKVYPFENTFCLIKIKPEDYSSYYSASGLYKSYYDNSTNKPFINNDGYTYIATIDYIAYQNNRTKEEIIDYQDVLCRDIVADNLLKNGFTL